MKSQEVKYSRTKFPKNSNLLGSKISQEVKISQEIKIPIYALCFMNHTLYKYCQVNKLASSVMGTHLQFWSAITVSINCEIGTHETSKIRYGYMVFKQETSQGGAMLCFAKHN